MKTLRSLRILILAMFVCLIPASSFAGVFISVGFAPPVLPAYDQPPCPEDGWIWTPGYWAYGDDGYYWVPGTWVPAPYEGALWTPPWWGWSDGLYVFHPGYWGDHVGYYGGVNYGFGYMGIGFVGGMWRGHSFIYNTAVWRVDDRYIHNTYVDRDVVRRYTIENDRHIAFSGGRDGIHHDPLPEEHYADHDRHVYATNFQQSHESAARSDRSFYARNNGGRPNNVVVQRPMGGSWNQNHSMPQNQGNGNRGYYNNSQPNNQDRNFNGQPNNQNNNRNYNNQRPNNGYNPPPNNQDRNFNGQPNNQNNNRNYNNQRPNNGPNPPPNAGNQQNNNSQRWNNGNAGDQRGNSGNQPYHAQPQPQSRPAPPQPQPQPQQQPHNNQGNQGGNNGGNHGGDRGGDHGGDHGGNHDQHDRQH